MKFGSVASGIESASLAWMPLGWRPQFYSEIDRFPCTLLQHYHPTVPNLGDMNGFRSWPKSDIDVLVGGTPCQTFSIAGLRAGLADPRGQLTLVYLAIAERYRPRWVVWENVPDVLSSDGGRAFGSFIGGLAELGYGYAWRVLDAQYFGLAQRRKRVFVVGCLGGWSRAAAVLFESASLRGDPAPRREARQTTAGTIAASSARRGGVSEGERGGLIAGTLPAHHSVRAEAAWQGNLIANTLRAEGFDSSDDGTKHTLIPTVFNMRGREEGNVPEVDPDGIVAGLRASSGGSTRSMLAFGGNNTSGPIPVSTAVRAHGSPHLDFETETLLCFDETQITSATNRCNPQAGDPTHPLVAHGRPPTIAFEDKRTVYSVGVEQSPALRATPSEHSNGGGNVSIINGHAVRRLTPLECERLQGFPDNYTLIQYRGKLAKDGPRYKAIGNSMAVNVMHWIGQRIQLIEEIT